MEEETQPNWNMQELGELLPFLSEKLVNELVQKHYAAHGAEGLEEFLPFMGEKKCRSAGERDGRNRARTWSV